MGESSRIRDHAADDGSLRVAPDLARPAGIDDIDVDVGMRSPTEVAPPSRFDDGASGRQGQLAQPPKRARHFNLRRSGVHT
jgi:hypothetical protein